MKIKKLIAIDLDGTLLSDDGKLLPFSENFLKRLSSLSYCIVLTSGRPFRSMEDFYHRLLCQGPIICYNGADVFNPSDPSFPSQCSTFPQEIVKSIYQKTLGKATTFMCESKSTVYGNRRDSYLDHFFWYTGMDTKLGPLDETLDCDPMTAIMKCSHSNDALFEAIVGEYKNQGIVLHHWTSSLYSELARVNVSKGHALAYIIDLLGVKKEDVIAFGDADNDLQMLSLAGNAYCMKNCKSQLLRSKFPITKESNNNDGVALTLERLFKL